MKERASARTRRRSVWETCEINTSAPQIPVYKGCSGPLLDVKRDAGDYHGKDGLGDVPDPDAPGLELVQKKKAVTALIKMIKQNPGEVKCRSADLGEKQKRVTNRAERRSVAVLCVQVTLVATAPLTNLAVAVQLEPSLPQKLKALYIMGGNTDCGSIPSFFCRAARCA